MPRGKRIYFYALIAAAVLQPVASAWAEAGGHGHAEHGGGDHGHAAHAAADPFNATIKSRSSRPLSFDKYKKYLRGVCAAVEQDGRREQLYEILKANTDKVPECPGCRPLLKAFASACRGSSIKRRPKKKVKQDTEDSEDHKHEKDGKHKDDSVIHKQREPNVVALDALALSFDRIARDEKRRVQALPAVEYLAGIFRKSAGRTRAQVEYLDIMAEYILAPFSELAQYRDRRARIVAESAKDAHIDPFMKNLSTEEEEDLYDF